MTAMTNGRRARWLRMGMEAQVSIPLFAVLLLAVIWGVTWHVIDSERRGAREAAADSVQELVSTYEAQAARNLMAIDQTLKVLRYAVERKGAAGALADLKLHDLLPSGLVFVVSVTDAQGRVIARNPAAPPVSVAGQPYFEFHRRHNAGLPYASHALRDAPRGAAHLHFTRRLDDEAGQFAGIAMVEVDPAYFTSAYERGRLGAMGALALVGEDGVVRALRVGALQTWGQVVSLPVAGPAEGRAPAVSSWDGVPRYLAARQLAGFPLWALVGLSAREQMAPFEQQRRASLWQASMASVAVLMAASMLWLWSFQGAKARRRIRRAQATYAAASEANLDAFFVLRAVRDRRGRIVDFRISTANVRAERMTGLSKEQLRAHTLCSLLPESLAGGLFEKIAHVAGAGGVHEEEMANTMAQLRASWLHWQVVGVEGGVVAIVRDISERKQAELRIVHLANHDPLTGLPNRSQTGDRLQQAIRQAQRTGRAVAVAFIDLDSFKMVNDGLGHTAGDDLLKQVAGRMVACLRRYDTVGRFGGDEFVLVLPEQHDSPGALAALLEKVRAAVIEPVLLDGVPVQVSCSIGVALYPRDGLDAETLLLNADAAMYGAKDTGKNSVRFFSALAQP